MIVSNFFALVRYLDPTNSFWDAQGRSALPAQRDWPARWSRERSRAPSAPAAILNESSSRLIDHGEAAGTGKIQTAPQPDLIRRLTMSQRRP